MDDATPREQYDKLIRSLQHAFGPQNREFRKSQLCQDTVEYIIQRENVLEAINDIHKVSWQNINPNNRVLAEQIKQNTLHALYVMIEAMRKIELNYL